MLFTEPQKHTEKSRLDSRGTLAGLFEEWQNLLGRHPESTRTQMTHDRARLPEVFLTGALVCLTRPPSLMAA